MSDLTPENLTARMQLRELRGQPLLDEAELQAVFSGALSLPADPRLDVLRGATDPHRWNATCTVKPQWVDLTAGEEVPMDAWPQMAWLHASLQRATQDAWTLTRLGPGRAQDRTDQLPGVSSFVGNAPGDLSMRLAQLRLIFPEWRQLLTLVNSKVALQVLRAEVPGLPVNGRNPGLAGRGATPFEAGAHARWLRLVRLTQEGVYSDPYALTRRVPASETTQALMDTWEALCPPWPERDDPLILSPEAQQAATALLTHLRGLQGTDHPPRRADPGTWDAGHEALRRVQLPPTSRPEGHLHVLMTALCWELIPDLAGRWMPMIRAPGGRSYPTTLGLRTEKLQQALAHG